MSAAQAAAAPTPQRVSVPDTDRLGQDRPARPRLRVVQAPAHARTRVPFVLLCIGVLASSLLGALLLHTSMAQGEYERFALQSRLAQSARAQQQLTAELLSAQSSDQLTRAAQGLGMVETTTGGFLRLSDGTVLGAPAPAGEDE